MTHQKIEALIRQGNLSALRKLPNKSLFCIGKQGRSLLHLACYLAQPYIISWLLEKGLDPYKRDNTGFTPYDYAKDTTVQAGLAKASVPNTNFNPPFRAPGSSKSAKNQLQLPTYIFDVFSSLPSSQK